MKKKTPENIEDSYFEFAYRAGITEVSDIFLVNLWANIREMKRNLNELN